MICGNPLFSFLPEYLYPFLNLPALPPVWIIPLCFLTFLLPVDLLLVCISCFCSFELYIFFFLAPHGTLPREVQMEILLRSQTHQTIHFIAVPNIDSLSEIDSE